MARRFPLRSTTLLGGLLLVVAGMLQLLAAAIRWAPCFGPVETLDLGDGIIADTCALAEDHARDYLWVSAPFEVTPGAVLLAGIASLLLTVFWLLWAVQLRGDPLGALLAVLSAAGWLVALAAPAAPAAAVTVLAGCAFLAAAALGTSRRAPGSIVGMEIEVDRH